MGGQVLRASYSNILMSRFIIVGAALASARKEFIEWFGFSNHYYRYTSGRGKRGPYGVLKENQLYPLLNKKPPGEWGATGRLN